LTEVKKEALRYLGYRGNPPDEATAALIDKGYKALCDTVSPHYCHKIVAKEDAGALIKGNDIVKHLDKSERVIFFAATLGSGADKLIRTAEITNMAYALVLDALASAMTEEFCDTSENELKTLYGGHFTWRYSPGYGDYPIELQPDIIRFLNADKLIGLTATESNILIPRKSVTAVIGVSEHEQDSGVRSCATCNMRETCKFRRNGTNCK
jgi:5-methyltetrahydrofolate--homocysteine methyltransferase